MNARKKIIAITPMLTTIIYLAIGFIYGIWHPTWVIFFAIPIVSTVLNLKFGKGVYPLLCGLAYVVVGITWGIWHPTWLIFLTIPIFYTLAGKSGRGSKKHHCDNGDTIEIIEADEEEDK